MSDVDDGYGDYVSLEEQFALMVKATELLRLIRFNAEHTRHQFGEPPEFLDLVKEIENAQETWISSNC